MSTSPMSSASASDDLRCSAKGCRAAAAWALRWNNPKLHPPERRKTWLACPEHRERLSSFLSARGFLREELPAVDAARADASRADAAGADARPDAAEPSGSAPEGADVRDSAGPSPAR